WPCGSMSTRSVLCPRRARQAARLMLVVVFPQPPFWLMIATVRIAQPSLVQVPHSPCSRVDLSTPMMHPEVLIGSVSLETLGLSGVWGGRNEVHRTRTEATFNRGQAGTRGTG